MREEDVRGEAGARPAAPDEPGHVRRRQSVREVVPRPIGREVSSAETGQAEGLEHGGEGQPRRQRHDDAGTPAAPGVAPPVIAAAPVRRARRRGPRRARASSAHARPARRLDAPEGAALASPPIDRRASPREDDHGEDARRAGAADPHRSPTRPRPVPRRPTPTNARYLTSLDGFNIKQPAIPAHAFRAERDRALDPRRPTGLVPLDLAQPPRARRPGDHAASSSSATRGSAPARRWRRASPRARSSTHVIRGAGPPGSATARRSLGGRRRLLRCPAATACGTPRRRTRCCGSATNEPQLRSSAPRRRRRARAPIRPALYPMAEIRRRLLGVYLDPRGAAMAGQVGQPGERRPWSEPDDDADLHAGPELAPARRGPAGATGTTPSP